MPNIYDNEDLYNVIVLGGVSSPGQVTLSGHDSTIKWDVKEGPSLNGATTTRKGRVPIEFTASFYLLKDVSQGVDDFAAWPAFQQLIESTVAGPTPKALDIYHPDLSTNGIKSVCKASIGGRTYDGKGGAIQTVKFQEYRPPKIQGGTPVGSKATANDPNAAAKAQLSALTAQYKATPWG